MVPYLEVAYGNTHTAYGPLCDVGMLQYKLGQADEAHGTLLRALGCQLRALHANAPHLTVQVRGARMGQERGAWGGVRCLTWPSGACLWVEHRHLCMRAAAALAKYDQGKNRSLHARCSTPRPMGRSSPVATIVTCVPCTSCRTQLGDLLTAVGMGPGQGSPQPDPRHHDSPHAGPAAPVGPSHRDRATGGTASGDPYGSSSKGSESQLAERLPAIMALLRSLVELIVEEEGPGRGVEKGADGSAAAVAEEGDVGAGGGGGEAAAGAGGGVVAATAAAAAGGGSGAARAAVGPFLEDLGHTLNSLGLVQVGGWSEQGAGGKHGLMAAVLGVG